jgi:hypothetical protein
MREKLFQLIFAATIVWVLPMAAEESREPEKTESYL